MASAPERLPLAALPTPLQRLDRLTAAWGGPTIWVKRDDMTGFGLSGNKVRKLEYHFAAAVADAADTVITCGAIQSNHCRATALAAARLGFDCLLLLRSTDGAPSERVTGNHLLQRLSGAQIRYITPDQYIDRDALMAEEAERLAAAGRRCWVIAEGASDPLGMWGFVAAMEELAAQLPRQLPADAAPPAIWHAASSAGTTAGMVWGTDRLSLATPVIGCSIGDPAAQVEQHVRDIWRDAVDRYGGEIPSSPWEIIDSHIGGGYGIVSDDELAAQVEATTLTGLILDPTYTGKALYGLRREIELGRFEHDDHVVFWHTGGGFAAFAHDFSAAIG